MGRQSRALDILVAAQLADKQLAQAQLAGQRDAQRMAGWANLLSTGIDAGTQAVGKLQAFGDERAKEQAHDVALRYAGTTGDLTPDTLVVAPPVEKPKETPAEFQYKPWAAPLLAPEAPKIPDYVPDKPSPETEIRPVTRVGQTDPFTPLRYAETPGAYARRVVAESGEFKGAAADPFAWFTSGSRERGRRAAEAAIAQDVHQQRAALDRSRFETGKVLADQGFKQAGLNLDVAKFNQNESQFGRKLTADEQAAKAKREFEGTQGDLNRANRTENAGILAAGQAARAADANALRNRVPDVDRRAVGDFAIAVKHNDRVLGRLDDLERKGKSIGLVNAGIDKVAAKLGLGDDELTSFRSDTTAVRAAYRKALTGLGVSVPEIEETLTTMPTEFDSPSAFRSKAAATRQRVADQIDVQLGLLEAEGFETSGLRAYLAPLLKAPASRPQPSNVRAPQIIAPMKRGPTPAPPPVVRDPLDDAIGN